MIGKQTKGRGFRKLLDYLHNSDNAKLIGGNMSGRNARELSKEFRVSRQLNPDAERVVYHVSLSAAKDDVISEDKWCEIGNRYMKEMGFDANQYVIFRHENTDDDHVHIAASRIRMDTGLLVDDSWDYVRSEKVLRQIEIDYDLVQVQGSRERLNRTQSTGQFRRIKREQEEYEQGKRDTPPEPSIKELVQQTIDNLSVDHPQMPTLIMRLQQAGISVRTGFTRNGKSKGISYEKDGIAFSGTQLGAAYTFPGLQKHLRIDYQPQRDDARIEHLLNNPVKQAVENQQPINAIAEFVERSAVESTLMETLPKLIHQLSAYHRQLEEGRTTLDNLRVVINHHKQRLSLQRAVDAIADFIEQSAVESTLIETLPQITQQLSKYQQQLQQERTTLDDLRVAITHHEQKILLQRAVDTIAEFIEQSAVESTLVETLPQITQQLSTYQQQLQQGRTTLDSLRLVVTHHEQRLSSQKAVDAMAEFIEQSAIESTLMETLPQITQQLSTYHHQLQQGRTALDNLRVAIAENKVQLFTTPKPKLNQNQAVELYQYYSGDLQSLLVIDRDKEIANRALLDNRPAQDVEEIVKASPVGWTDDEAKLLVLIATNQLALNREQKQRLPQFTPPAEDESLWPALQNYLTQKRGISDLLVQPLHLLGLGYIDQQRNVVFIKRSLNGEKSGALVWDTTRQDNRCSQKSENTQSDKGWFHIKLGGEADDKIERVFLCDSPIDALSIADMDRKAHKGMPPVRTMYMVVDDPHNLPLEFLRNISRIGLAFNKDKQGQETASAVLELLPQAKRLPPDNQTWNQDLLERLNYEQEKRKQQQRGFSR